MEYEHHKHRKLKRSESKALKTTKISKNFRKLHSLLDQFTNKKNAYRNSPIIHQAFSPISENKIDEYFSHTFLQSTLSAVSSMK